MDGHIKRLDMLADNLFPKNHPSTTDPLPPAMISSEYSLPTVRHHV
jgi:hypothetical protein